MTARRVRPARRGAALLALAVMLTHLLGVTPVPLSPAVAQESAGPAVAVTAQRAAAFDRLVLDFPGPVAYRVAFDGSDLVFRFEQPAELVLAPLGGVLTDLAGSPRIEEAGRRLVLPFAQRRALTHFQLGGRLIVDLGRDGKAPPTSERMQAALQAATADAAPARPPAVAPGSAQGGQPAPAAAPTAAPAPAPARAAPPVPAVGGLPVLLRVGVHEEYDRLVFDWPENVGFELEEAAIGTTRIRFAEPGRLDASVLSGTRVARLRELVATNAEDGLTIELSYPAGVSARAFSLDRRIVVDLAGPKGRLRLARVRKSERPSAVAQAAPAPAPAASAGQGPTPLFPTPAAKPEPSPPKAPAPAAAEKASAEAEERERDKRPPPQVRESQPMGFQIERTDAFGRQRALPQPGFAAPWPEPVVLRFDWRKPVRAAVLQTGPAVLLVFDREAPVWAEQRIADLAPELAGLRRYDLETSTAFGFEVSALVSPLLRRDGDSWILDLRPRPALLDQPLPLASDPRTGTLRLSAQDPGTPILLADPATGGRLYAVPLGEEAGFSPGRRFPQFEILSSPQGLFVAALSDRVSVAADGRGVTVRGVDALAVANQPALPEAPATIETGRRLFDPEAWRLDEAGEYSETRQELQTAVATSRTAAELTAARVSLARFYFAHGLGRETLGLLELLFTDQPGLRRDPELLLLAGASQVLAGEYAAAVETLGDPALVGELEAEPWKGLLAAAAQDWPVAADRFAGRLAITEDYARPVRVRFALAAAEGLLQTGDIAGAYELLKNAKPLLRTAPERARHKLVRGRAMLADGQTTAARKLLDEVSYGGFGAASAQARLLLLERDLADGSLAGAAAIEELEKLRFAWRGDAFEFALLLRLAELYQAEGRYREALRSLRSAAANFPGNPRVETAAIRMQELFTDLFTGEQAARMAPLSALSLYDEFRELTPPGPQGDAIIEALADRLVDIDLLERAALLLEDQVANRLTGLERARVGTRLALLRLLDRKPAEAIEALDVSASSSMPPELRAERTRLRAKAAIDRGQEQIALDLLAGDESLEADRLRIEVDRAAGRWSRVAETLAKHLPAAGVPLEPADAAKVVETAVAQVLAEQRAELQFLARSYGDAMAETDHAETFRLLAGQAGPEALASISEQLGQVEQAQAFMADYRQRLTDGSLSALN